MVASVAGRPIAAHDRLVPFAMPKIGANRRSPSACELCGTDLVGKLYVQVDDRKHCEGCVLQRRWSSAADDSTSMLAESLAAALDLREHEIGLHSRRVACHTLVLARRFTDDPLELQQTYWGALLHDLGKIGVRDAVLLKQGPLMPDEWSEMKQHPQYGYDILSAVPGMRQAAAIVVAHEERYDGSGYPRSLCAQEIPVGARIFATIDTLDAMTSDRPYRKAGSFEQATREIIAGSGTQFDPMVITAFQTEIETLRDMVALKSSVNGFPPATIHT